jgi:hypothetical protein
MILRGHGGVEPSPDNHQNGCYAQQDRDIQAYRAACSSGQHQGAQGIDLVTQWICVRDDLQPNTS